MVNAAPTPVVPSHRPWWIRALILIGLWSIPMAIFAALDIARAPEPARQGMSIWKMLLGLAAMWYPWALLTPVTLALGRALPVYGRAPGRLVLHTTIHVLVAGTFSVMLLSISILVLGVLRTEVESSTQSFGAAFMAMMPWGLVWHVIIYFAVLGVGSTVHLSRIDRERRLHASRIEAQLARARLDALRAQLHPHFLFNTLHAIASLVRQGRSDAAVQMIAQLGDLLRSTLRSDRDDRIPLSDELDLLRLYFSIEEVRLGDRLTVEFAADPAVETALVPTLILQPLAENAIRHGVAPVDRPCTVRVAAHREAETLVIEVTNDGAPYDPAAEPPPGPHLGLENVRERLHESHGDAATCTLDPIDGSDRGARAIVRMPLDRSETP